MDGRQLQIEALWQFPPLQFPPLQRLIRLGYRVQGSWRLYDTPQLSFFPTYLVVLRNYSCSLFLFMGRPAEIWCCVGKAFEHPRYASGVLCGICYPGWLKA